MPPTREGGRHPRVQLLAVLRRERSPGSTSDAYVDTAVSEEALAKDYLDAKGDGYGVVLGGDPPKSWCDRWLRVVHVREADPSPLDRES